MSCKCFEKCKKADKKSQKKDLSEKILNVKPFPQQVQLQV